ncbi:MAG: DUF1615 domain-containing protein [Betaproteobacteria bacterium]
MIAPARRSTWLTLAVVALVVVEGCAVPERPSPSTPVLGAAEGRARIARLIPDGTPDRAGWATDLYAAIAALDIPPTPENVCAAIAVIGQESSFRNDPPVPGLASIARREIESRRERAGVPRLVLDAALALPSSNGRSYGERLGEVKTEMQMSDLFEDFIDRVPLGRTFFEDRNPVRTGGPMQVSVAFAESFAAERPYPYPRTGSIRKEIFTRRGGLYFGVAHLLDYRAPYDRYRYRFADYNAGRYASRNAAFQNAVTQVSGIPLARDGDLLRYENGRPAREPGATEAALRVLARRIDLDDAQIRRDLELGIAEAFDRTRSYEHVFALADRTRTGGVPRAVVPDIDLHSPKITRKLTTEWFAGRVDARFQACLRRADG